jgi:predicted sugar kinase
MFFQFRSWLRRMMFRLMGKRFARAVRRKENQRRCGVRLCFELLERRETPATGLTSFSAGAYVIDMGQATQTVANSLQPYGMVYDLIQNQHIPVDWAINPNSHKALKVKRQ